ncbi:MAG TPA: MDR family MFS transporter [Aliidongia sp.]|nr:MDR family MFS transporter [Aliidongia sp.]
MDGNTAAALAPQDTPPTQREIRMVYLGFMLVLGLAALDQSIVATALPRIVSDVGGVTHLSWVVTAYVLASTATMPLYGKLSDQYGRKPLVYAGVLIFLAGSMLAGLAQTMPQLILFRAIQGLGAGGLLPLAQITIGDLIAPRERGRYQGLIGAVYALCSVAGPVLGGAITELLSWHWIFYINLPFGIAALIMIAVALPKPKRTERRKIDYPGAALIATATTALLLVLSLGGSELPWRSPLTFALAAAALVLTVLFVIRERVAPEPVVPLHLFRDKVFVIASFVLAFAFMGLTAATVFFPLFFQIVLGVEAANSGLLTVPLLIGMVVAARVNGRLVSATGRYKPMQVSGLGTAVAAFVVLAWATRSGLGIPVIEPALVALGLGLGMVMPNMTIAVQNAVPRSDMGAATATLAYFRSLGSVLGVAGSGALMAAELRQGLTARNLPSGIDAKALLQGGIQQIQALPPAAHAAVVEIYRQAIAHSFAAGVVTAVIAFVALLFIPELPLRSDRAPS